MVVPRPPSHNNAKASAVIGQPGQGRKTSPKIVARWIPTIHQNVALSPGAQKNQGRSQGRMAGLTATCAATFLPVTRRIER